MSHTEWKETKRKFNYQSSLQDEDRETLMWIALDYSEREGYILDLKFESHPAWERTPKNNIIRSTTDMARTMFRDSPW